MTATIESTTVESSTTEVVRKPATKASEHRRITKPIMEKKRRARINNSLNELKSLILDALNKDPTRHSKLEKADILEMTVRHLQKLQRQQAITSTVNDPSVLNKYRAGYAECASEVNRYLGNMEPVDQGVRQRILGHLNHCVNNLNQMATKAQLGLNPATAFPGMMPPSNSSLHVQIPVHSSFAMSTDLNNNNSFVTGNMCSSPVDLKTNLATPPSSASSSTSSHFAFNLNLDSPNKSLPIDLLYRKHFASSISPGSSSYLSGQTSPACSEDMDMVVDCTMKRGEPWRPW